MCVFFSHMGIAESCKIAWISTEFSCELDFLAVLILWSRLKEGNVVKLQNLEKEEVFFNV